MYTVNYRLLQYKTLNFSLKTTYSSISSGVNIRNDHKKPHLGIVLLWVLLS